MDTDTIVAAMRSTGGASAELLRLARAGRITLTATAALCLEYEAMCSRPEHVAAANLNPADLEVFLDAIMSLMEPAEVWFLWRPQLRDPGDELVLEAAVNGQADAIATLDQRQFRDAAARFGIDILLPSAALGRAA